VVVVALTLKFALEWWKATGAGVMTLPGGPTFKAMGAAATASLACFRKREIRMAYGSSRQYNWP